MFWPYHCIRKASYYFCTKLKIVFLPHLNYSANHFLGLSIFLTLNTLVGRSLWVQLMHSETRKRKRKWWKLQFVSISDNSSPIIYDLFPLLKLLWLYPCFNFHFSDLGSQGLKGSISDQISLLSDLVSL